MSAWGRMEKGRGIGLCEAGGGEEVCVYEKKDSNEGSPVTHSGPQLSDHRHPRQR